MAGSCLAGVVAAAGAAAVGVLLTQESSTFPTLGISVAVEMNWNSVSI